MFFKKVPQVLSPVVSFVGDAALIGSLTFVHSQLQAGIQWAATRFHLRRHLAHPAGQLFLQVAPTVIMWVAAANIPLPTKDLRRYQEKVLQSIRLTGLQQFAAISGHSLPALVAPLVAVVTMALSSSSSKKKALPPSTEGEDEGEGEEKEKEKVDENNDPKVEVVSRQRGW